MIKYLMILHAIKYEKSVYIRIFITRVQTQNIYLSKHCIYIFTKQALNGISKDFTTLKVIEHLEMSFLTPFDLMSGRRGNRGRITEQIIVQFVILSALFLIRENRFSTHGVMLSSCIRNHHLVSYLRNRT